MKVLSVIIPVYRAKKTLFRLLKSISDSNISDFASLVLVFDKDVSKLRRFFLMKTLAQGWLARLELMVMLQNSLCLPMRMIFSCQKL